MKHIVVSDHPYYPEVYYFDTYEDALDKRDEVKDDLFTDDDGKYEARVFVTTVQNIIVGRSYY